MFEKEKSLVESILFLESDPVDIQTICKITQLPKDLVVDALAFLREKYEDPSHGIELIQLGGGYTLSVKEELWDFLKARYGKKNDNRLSKVAIEVLSIIAYKQPITRAEIENIRGVSSDTMVRLLLDKDLIRESGKKDVLGKPTLYSTTKNFLKLFRIGSIADLPKLDDVSREKFNLN